ncbi:MAG: polysaccharide pyruvyl transferase CsaB, partial [Clostridia bacterium]|nr:polysaccharide pyruvyl transferase CsaB [Clostridia bacterium]
ACEKPVIVAGNEGYIGIFDEDKLPCAVETNFCCRGLAPSSCEALLADVTTLLTNRHEENARLGQFGRQVIINSYSLSKMAQDCVKMYTAATDTKKWDAVISGYYGYQNAGDESLLYAMIQNLRTQKDDVRLLVLSKDPKATEAAYDVRAINRYNLLKIRKAFKQSHLLIFGGGSLIQDVTSSKSLWYYLSVVKQAIKLSVPVIFYANGIGPIEKEKNQKKVLKVLNKVDKISLREPNSYYELKRMGVDMDRVVITADPALTICSITQEEVSNLLEKEGVPKDARLLGISIRDWKSCKPSYWNQLARGITQICRQFNLVPVWIPLKHPDDIVISQTVAEKVEVPGYVLTKDYNANELVGIVKNCDLMIAMRLHSMIYAAGAGVPAIGLSYDPKVSSFAKYIGVNTTLHLENLTDEGLASMARDILLNRETIKDTLCEKVSELKQKAMENVNLAMELMNQTNEQSGDKNATDGN